MPTIRRGCRRRAPTPRAAAAPLHRRSFASSQPAVDRRCVRPVPASEGAGRGPADSRPATHQHEARRASSRRSRLHPARRPRLCPAPGRRTPRCRAVPSQLIDRRAEGGLDVTDKARIQGIACFDHASSHHVCVAAQSSTSSRTCWLSVSNRAALTANCATCSREGGLLNDVARLNSSCSTRCCARSVRHLSA